MADLTVTEATDGLGLPLAMGDCTLSAQAPGTAWLIAPYPGRRAACSAALAPLGLSFPAPGQGLAGQGLAAGGRRIVWAGRDQAFLFGAAPPEGLAEHAALTDQSDGWAGLRLQGPDAEAVLARLVPLDLRIGAFPEDHVARSLLGHMPLLIQRTGPETFALMTYRSMAGSAVQEIAHALKAVAARRRLG